MRSNETIILVYYNKSFHERILHQREKTFKTVESSNTSLTNEFMIDMDIEEILVSG